MEEMLKRIQGKTLICGKSSYMIFKARNLFNSFFFFFKEN